MDTDKTARGGNRPKQTVAKGTIILIGCCAAVAMIGIFIGIIVIYGGSQAALH